MFVGLTFDETSNNIMCQVASLTIQSCA